MALNTLPMPKDMLYTKFEGWHIGNQTSCDIQGFLYVSSAAALYSYFTSLLLYYVCSITFQMRDEMFRKYIEPLLQVLTWAISMFASVNGLVNKMYNPSLLKNWCATELLPFWCIAGSEDDTSNIDTTCIRGTYTAQSYVRNVYIFSFFLFSLVVASVILIIYSVYKTSASTIHEVVCIESNTTTSSHSIPNPSTKKKEEDDDEEEERVQLDEEECRHKTPRNTRHIEMEVHHEYSIVSTTTTTKNNTTKVILVQVGAYLSSIALLTTGTCVLMPYKTSNDPPPIALQYFALIASSSYGIINFCIFVGHKVFDLYRVNTSSSIRSLIWKVLTSRNETVFVFENVNDILKTQEEIAMSAPMDKKVHHHDKVGSDGLFSDPIRRAHVITMFHLRRREEEHSTDDVGDNVVSIPSRDDKQAISIDENDLPSHNDGSSSFRRCYGSDKGDITVSINNSRKSLLDEDV